MMIIIGRSPLREFMLTPMCTLPYTSKTLAEKRLHLDYAAEIFLLEVGQGFPGTHDESYGFAGNH